MRLPLALQSLLVAAVFWPGPGIIAAETLSLDAAINQALSQNPVIAGAEARAESAKARLSQAKGSLWPQLNLNYLHTNSDNPLDVFAARLMTRSVDPATDFSAQNLNEPEEVTLQTTRLNLNWPIYTGGQRLAGIAGARAMSEAGDLGFRFTRDLVRYQVTSTYRALQAADAGLDIATDAVKAGEQHVATTRRLTREGRIIKSDQLTAEVFLARMKGALAQARQQRETAQLQLSTILGNQAGQSYTPVSWVAPVISAVTDADALVARALAQRPDLAAVKAQEQAALARLRGARGKLHPVVGLTANRDHYDSDFGEADSWNAGAYVQLNLFNGGSDYYGIRAEHQAVAEAGKQLEQKRLQVAQEVRTAISRKQIAADRLLIANDTIGRAQSAVTEVQRRYGQGRTILIDLLQAEAALVQTRTEALSAGLEYELADAALALAVGNSAATKGE
ncbi:MAG: TolC family protein [Gammaproteobacteria bacterium]|nr:TolC family protein [Gammaproteobacteria bacterium]